jgi:hypothetical protein
VHHQPVTIALTDTGSGVFMGMSSSDLPSRRWGEIDLVWTACRRMNLTWRPEAWTGLPDGNAELMQLTMSRSAPCDLAHYAAARNGEPAYLDYDVVQ